MYHSHCMHDDNDAMTWNESSNTFCPDCQAAMLGSVIQFLRCGAKPESGYSWNNDTMQHEAGLSVFPIVEGVVRWTHDADTFWGRPWFLGRGMVVGFGGSGEPLVKVVAIKKATKKQQAQYRAAE